jgi:hypothetical protein
MFMLEAETVSEDRNGWSIAQVDFIVYESRPRAKTEFIQICL